MSSCKWITTVSGSDLDVGCDLDDGHEGPHVVEWDERQHIRTPTGEWTTVRHDGADHYRVEWTGGWRR